MSKYANLWEYVAAALGKRDGEKLVMTFGEIGQAGGVAVDHSFLTYKKELAFYGCKVDKISLKDQTVTFVKIND